MGRSEFAGSGVSVVERSDLLGEGAGECRTVLEQAGAGVEVSDEDGFVTGVRDELFGVGPRCLVGGEQVAGRTDWYRSCWYAAAKFVENDFAVGPPMIDWI